jgi:DNA-binding transcriptional LysR family regulator
MDLTLQQLRVVLAVAETGSFTSAGERLHVAQSSLSRTVAEVEHRLGVRLFERTTRRVDTTAAGREFVTIAGRVVAGFDAGMSHFQGYLKGRAGAVSIATLPSLAATLLPPVVVRFRRQMPDVELRIVDAVLAHVLRLVRSGEVDVAVTVDWESPEDLHFEQLAADEFCCVVPRGHPFTARRSLAWADLHGEPFIAFDGSSRVRLHVDHALDRAGVRPGRTTEARNVSAVAGLVAAGLGVSAVPTLVLPLLAFADLEHRPLTDPVVTRRVGVVTHPDRPLSPAAQGFLAHLRRAPHSGVALPAGTSWTSPDRPGAL